MPYGDDPSEELAEQADESAAWLRLQFASEPLGEES